MKRMLLALVLAGSFALTGCETNQDTGTLVGAVAGGVIGNQFGKGGGRAAATLAGAVIGGIAGNEIGRKMDERDRELAQQAEAWELRPVRPSPQVAQSRQRPLRRDRARQALPARWPRLPRLHHRSTSTVSRKP